MQSKCSLVPCALQPNERIFTRSSKQERYDRERIQLCINGDLEQKLLKADPLLDGQSKEALLLANMIAFVQRYRAVQEQGSSKDYCDVAQSSVSPQDKKIDELVTMVNAIACKQQKLEECLTAAVNQNGQQPENKPNATRRRRRHKLGHIAKDCEQEESKPIQCFSRRGYEHMYRDCSNNLNGQGAVSTGWRSTAPRHLMH